MRSFAAVAVLVGYVAGATDYLKSYVPQEPTCYLPLDVLFLQDTTESFTDDLPNVVSQIPQMLSVISQYHPNSRFAVAEFKDKPYQPFGWPEDYCYRLAADLTSSPEDFARAYANLYASGGDDLPESQYQGCINAIQDPNTQWRNIGSGPNDVGAKVIIMSTDAVPHYEGDPSSSVQDPSWVPYPGHITSNLTYDCDNTRYPTYEQFASAFQGSEQTYLAILTPDTDADVVSVWQWVNEGLLMQAPEFYQFISDDSSDFILGVLKALESVTATVCPASSTTVAPTTTTAAVTTPSTTTAAVTTPTTTTAAVTTPTTTTAAVTTPTTTTAAVTTPTTTTAAVTTPSTTTAAVTTPSTTTAAVTTPSTTTAAVTTPTTGRTFTDTPSTRPVTSTETTLTSTATGKPCPGPCPGPHPCGCDGFLLKVGGKPVEVNVQIDYKL